MLRTTKTGVGLALVARPGSNQHLQLAVGADTDVDGGVLARPIARNLWESIPRLAR